MGFLSNVAGRLNQESTDQESAGMEKNAGVTRIFFATDVDLTPEVNVVGLVQG